MPPASPLRTHAGGCHCGRVRFEVDAPATLDVLDVLECNCSICRMTGFLHLIVPASRFRLLTGDDALVEYRFNTGAVAARPTRRGCLPPAPADPATPPIAAPGARSGRLGAPATRRA